MIPVIFRNPNLDVSTFCLPNTPVRRRPSFVSGATGVPFALFCFYLEPIVGAARELAGSNYSLARMTLFEPPSNFNIEITRLYPRGCSFFLYLQNVLGESKGVERRSKFAH